MDSYTSEWNKETVMANATRLLHITQELAVDAVPKYTKKQYARLGFGSSSLMNMNEEDELALVQEAYTIAWKYLNLTLEYTPIARTTLKLHTHHGVLGNFVGTLGQDNRVLVGDNQGVYVCSSSGYMVARWYKPRTERTSTYPNSTTAYTGRVLTGTRTSTIQTGWPTNLDVMTDVERMSLEEPISILLRSDYWWLTWYPKQQYMMIHKSEYTMNCEHPSEVTWSYRVAPSSYRQFVIHNTQDWTTDSPSTKNITADFRTNLPLERHQTDYAYEVRNDRGEFEWVEIKGTLPVYKCPPMLLKYFNDSFPHVQFEGDESLEENNLYTEILDSINDPRAVGGYILWESAVLKSAMFYLQAEFVAVPLDTIFPIRRDSFYSRTYTRPEPRQHSSGQMVSSAANNPTWVYRVQGYYNGTGKHREYPDIQRSFNIPPLKLTVGTEVYNLYTNLEPARTINGLVIFPNFSPFMLTTAQQAFDDTLPFTHYDTTFLGVKYTPEGEAYAILVNESIQIRDWTVTSEYTLTMPDLKAQIIHYKVTGVDGALLNKFIKYRTVNSGGFKHPYLDMMDYKFQVKLSQRPYGNVSGGTSGIDYFAVSYSNTESVGHRFWAYSRESSQYQYMLNTPTGQSGFYEPDLPADTYKFPKTSEVF